MMQLQCYLFFFGWLSIKYWSMARGPKKWNETGKDIRISMYQKTNKKVSPVICWGFIFTGDIHVVALDIRCWRIQGFIFLCVQFQKWPVARWAIGTGRCGVCQIIPMFSQAFYRFKMYKTKKPNKPVQTKKLSILIRFWGGGRLTSRSFCFWVI